MAKLSKAARDKMPASEFGLPKSKGFPMGDKKHARLAISGATRSERAGNISPATESRIKAEARAKLGKGDSKSSERAAMVENERHETRSQERAESPAAQAKERRMGVEMDGERVTEHHLSATSRHKSLSASK